MNSKSKGLFAYSSSTSLSKSKPAFKPKTTLDNVVSSLVRAAVGGDTTAIPDEDLDTYVAEMIMKEAREKNMKYRDLGIRAYLPGGESRNLKPDRSFLKNIIKQTDSHNQALLRREQEVGLSFKPHNTRGDEDCNSARESLLIRRTSRSRSSSRSRNTIRSESPRRKRRRRSYSRSSSDGSNSCTSRSQSRRSSPQKRKTRCNTSLLTNNLQVTSNPTSSPPQNMGSNETHLPKTKIIRGRGAPKGSLRLDKVFNDSYDPKFDFGLASGTLEFDAISNDALDDEIVAILQEKQEIGKSKCKKDKKKGQKSKTKKKRKRKSED